MDYRGIAEEARNVFREIKKTNGAPGGDRTHDPLLRRQLLYPLSYQGVIMIQ